MIHSMSEVTSMVILVLILVVIAAILIGSVYLLNRGIKEQHVYNNTALPSLDEEEEEKQKEEEKQQFENILDVPKTKNTDWSDFNDSFEDDSGTMQSDFEPTEEFQTTPERTVKQPNSLPDL